MCKSFHTVLLSAVVLVVALSFGSAVAAQEESTSEETMSEVTTSEEATNDNVRVIRDNDGRVVVRGTAREQYGDNEVIVKTIPDKGRLADTGGLPLAGVAFVALASVGLGLSILRSATRRDDP